MRFFFINFPTTLDTLTNPTSGNTLNSPDHAGQHSDVNDIVEALEAKVGVNSSAVTTSHDYKLSAVTSSAKALTSGTSTQSVTGLTLTTPVINLGSDATGDIYYRNSGGALTRLGIGSSNQVLAVSAGLPSWVANPAATNGSTTVAGIFEAATAAEVTAGTGTGGTGAVLVVTPDALASSTPVFNGSGLTNIPGPKILAVYTDVTTSSNTTETTLLSTTIPANTLGTNGGLHFKVYISSLSNTSTSTAWTIRVKYGATTVASYAPQVAWTTVGGFVEGYLLATGSTGTQEANIYSQISTVGPVISSGTSSEDSTASKTFAITSQFSNSSGNDAITVKMSIVSKI